MTQPASITYWNRVEPSPRSESLLPGLIAAVRDPLWFLTRQWQLGEFQGEDAASPAFISVTVQSGQFDGWRAGDGPIQPYDGSAPLEALAEREPTTPDLRTAVELGQALERRLIATGLPSVVADAFRRSYPLPPPGSLNPAQARDTALVRLLRVCAGRTTDGLAALRAVRTAAPALPAELGLPSGTDLSAVLAWFTGWSHSTFGPIGRDDPAAWRPDRLEYTLQVTAAGPDNARLTLQARPGQHGEFDWYAFDEAAREPASPPASTTASTPASTPADMRRQSFSLLPAPVRFSGMPDPRWWNFEDARFNWSDVAADRRDLARMLVIDFMLVQGTDWYLIPLGQQVGSLVAVSQLVIRDVFGGYTLAGRADAVSEPGGRRWTMFSTTLSTSDASDALNASKAVADYFILPPSGLRATVSGPVLEEVRFVRDEQANLVWAVESITEDATGRPRSGRERATDTPAGAPDPPDARAPLRYQLATTVPVNWIPFVPVQIDAARRSIALQRAAMQRYVDGSLVAVAPVGRVLNPTGLADPAEYRVREEEVPRTGSRVLRGAHRARWVDGSTHLWTARRRRAGLGEAASGLRYDVTERSGEPRH
jgi:hypothetical protein